MAIINKGTAFSNGEQLSASKLNDLVDGATFGTDSVDNSTTLVNANGAITVRDSGITAAKLATGAVTTAKILDANVTFAKLTDVIDDDTMDTADAATLATSESIKAYTDSKTSDPARLYNNLAHSTVSANIQQNTTGRPLWVSFTFYTTDNIDFLIGEISPNSNMSSNTRVGQSRMIDTQTVDNCATQVTMIVPSQWYWRFEYLSNQAAQEIVHSSFIL